MSLNSMQQATTPTQPTPTTSAQKSRCCRKLVAPNETGTCACAGICGHSQARDTRRHARESEPRDARAPPHVSCSCSRRAAAPPRCSCPPIVLRTRLCEHVSLANVLFWKSVQVPTFGELASNAQFQKGASASSEADGAGRQLPSRVRCRACRRRWRCPRAPTRCRG